MTRFVWACGKATWHKTPDCPYYPRWEIVVNLEHPELPPGQHNFVLVKPEGATDAACYYKEV
jgi:hypothetical protein